MKINEVSLNDIKEYLRIEGDEENNFINCILAASKIYIKNYTGLSNEKLNEKEDLTIVLYVLCAEMYDNRQYIIEKNKEQLNPVAKSILDMHSINLL